MERKIIKIARWRWESKKNKIDGMREREREREGRVRVIGKEIEEGEVWEKKWRKGKVRKMEWTRERKKRTRASRPYFHLNYPTFPYDTHTQ